MSSLRGARIAGKAGLQCLDHRRGVVDRKRGLRQESDARVVRKIESVNVVHGFDQRHRSGRDLPEGADHFRVARVANEEDVPPFLDHPLRLPVHLGNQRARRVDVGQPAILRLGRNRFGHAVGGEDDRPVVGHFVELIDEYRAQFPQPIHDEAVVDDLVADIDRRAESFERELDDLDRAVDSRAEAARSGDQHFDWRAVQHWESHVSLRLQP